MRMKLALVGVLAAVGVGVVGAGLAAADPGNGNGATVVRDPYGSPAYCNVIDFINFSYSYIFECTIQITTTPDGTVNEWVRGQVLTDSSSPLPTSALLVPTSVTGELCDLVSGAYYAIAGVITPSGRVNLKCSSSPTG